MPKREAELVTLPLARLHPHPQNPRIALREDVVEGIRVSLEEAKSMPREHALRVRPFGDNWQIVWEAAGLLELRRQLRQWLDPTASKI